MYTFGSFSQYLIPFGRLPSDENLSIEQGAQEDQGYPLKLTNYLWYRNPLFFLFFCRLPSDVELVD